MLELKKIDFVLFYFLFLNLWLGFNVMSQVTITSSHTYVTQKKVVEASEMIML